MTIEASLPKELSRSHYPDNRFLALFRDNENLDPSLLNLENRIGGVSLRENTLILCKPQYGFALANLGEE